MKNLSIIVPTCDRINLIQNLLTSIKTALLNGNLEVEIIVTDDSISEITERFVKENYPDILWLKGPRRGPAANRNNGAKFATSEWLVFIDDDVIITDFFFESYQNAIFEYPEVQVFEGKTLADRERSAFNEESPINAHGGFLWSCNFCISRNLFSSLGGFDENYPFAAMEDVDLQYRLLRMGIAIRFVDTALVVHPWRLQMNMYQAIQNRYKSICYFLEKFPEKREEINRKYFFNAFIRGFLLDTCKNAFKFRFRGIRHKLIYDYLQLKYAITHGS